MSDSSDDESDIDDVGLIAPITQGDVRRIVAGQVITDLASTVKELVDNALDSGAKSINIRLFNDGIDVVEVSDDGCGVPKDSRPLLAMKHATSKIRSFDELYMDTYDEGQMQLKQLGFRGEALFSLANISQNLVISTRTEDEDIATKMEFKRDGYLDTNKTLQIPRKIGTTVAVVKLFDALPVRRADLIKRIKGQRAKMLKLLQAYGVLCVGVRFNLIDLRGPVGSPKAKTTTCLQTSQNSKSINETISQIFGSKFLAGLCPIQVDLAETIISSSELKIVEQAGVDKKMWRIEGLISVAPSSEIAGKTARDIQFFSINGRPVELPKLSKVIGEVWRNFESVSSGNSKKRPACVLALYLPNCIYDINVSPDKREVLLSDEAKIYDSVRKYLNNLWSSQSLGKFTANQVHDASKGGVKDFNANPVITDISAKDDCKLDAPPQDETKLSETAATPSRSSTLPMRRRYSRRNAVTRASLTGNLPSESGRNELFDHMARIQELRNASPTRNSVSFSTNVEKEDSSGITISGRTLAPIATKQNLDQPTSSEQTTWHQTKLSFSPSRASGQKEEIDTLNSMTESKTTNAAIDNQSDDDISTTEIGPINDCAKRFGAVGARKRSLDCNNNDSEYQGQEKVGKGGLSEDYPQTKKVKPDESDPSSQLKPSPPKLTIAQEQIQKESDSSMQDEDDEVEESASDEDTPEECTPTKEKVVWPGFKDLDSVVQSAKYAHKITSERASKLAAIKARRASEAKEGESKQDKSTNLSLSKDDFISMNVIGQFNQGFILALGQDGQLWILDQHACDEKYNFEKLCANTKVHEQKLLVPLPLELSPSEENCVLENMDIFERNGFRFKHDVTKPPRHRLSLTALPHSGSGGDGKKAVQFGAEDVGALCALLGADGAHSSSGYIAGSGSGADGQGKFGNNAVRRHASMNLVGGENLETIRLPKAVAMFASRACRSSVMIGESLTHQQMNDIVRRMKDLNHPWTCAHGRPTIRHIIDLVEKLICENSRK